MAQKISSYDERTQKHLRADLHLNPVIHGVVGIEFLADGDNFTCGLHTWAWIVGLLLLPFVVIKNIIVAFFCGVQGFINGFSSNFARPRLPKSFKIFVPSEEADKRYKEEMEELRKRYSR